MDHYLIVTRALDCIACKLAESNGTFTDLLQLEGNLVKEVLCITVKSYGEPISNLHPVFSLDHSFPNYKLMTVDTFNRLARGEDVADKVHFFNSKYSDGILETVREYPYNFEGVKQFCVDCITKDDETRVRVERVARSSRFVNHPR